MFILVFYDHIYNMTVINKYDFYCSASNKRRCMRNKLKQFNIHCILIKQSIRQYI